MRSDAADSAWLTRSAMGASGNEGTSGEPTTATPCPGAICSDMRAERIDARPLCVCRITASLLLASSPPCIVAAAPACGTSSRAASVDIDGFAMIAVPFGLAGEEVDCATAGTINITLARSSGGNIDSTAYTSSLLMGGSRQTSVRPSAPGAPVAAGARPCGAHRSRKYTSHGVLARTVYGERACCTSNASWPIARLRVSTAPPSTYAWPSCRKKTPYTGSPAWPHAVRLPRRRARAVAAAPATGLHLHDGIASCTVHPAQARRK